MKNIILITNGIVTKAMRAKPLLTLLMMALLMPANAQSTVGKDFWVTFLPNHEPTFVDDSLVLQLIVTGPRDCSGHVNNPHSHWSERFEVHAGQCTTVSIPSQGNYSEESDCILNQGLHVVTTDSVSLYVSNFKTGSFDVTNVLPTKSLGSEYIIQAYPPYHDFTEFSIIAVENNTKVDIHPTTNTFHGHEPNRVFTVTLNAGQCYQIMSAYSYVSSHDLSGSHIKARDNKPIAVFTGNKCTFIPPVPTPSNNDCCCDHLFEQLLPVSSWGQKFIVTGSRGRTNDRVRITAKDNYCEIKRNGTVVANLNLRQTYEYELSSNDPVDFIETSGPAQVYLYLTSYDHGGPNGDPSMVLVSPLEQRIKNVTFSTFNSGLSQNHYVNIVTETDHVSSMKLDGNDIASQFHPVPYDSAYSFARVSIPHGSHTLSNNVGGKSRSGFIAHVYGLGAGESYAYSVGSMVVTLTSQIIVDDVYSSSVSNGFWRCEGDTVDFSLFANFEISRAEWDFGDNTTGMGLETTHVYPHAGNYKVQCEVYTLAHDEDSLVGKLSTRIHVQQPTEEDVYHTDCDFYTWNGETYTNSGDYSYLGQSLGGCDSIVRLHLSLHPSVTIPYEATACNEYEWQDSVYTQSGIYQHVEGQTDFGCDSIAELHLTIEHTPLFNINGPSEVYCASDIWSGMYYYHIVDSTEMEQGPIIWECSNPQWIITPLSDFSCMLIVHTTGSATLTATTTAGCTGSKTIQLNADNYALDEAMEKQIALYPNPAQTQVTLKAPEMNRIRVFDCIGQKSKDVECIHSESIDIDISDLGAGIYLVEIVTSVGRTCRRLTILR